MNNVAVSAMEVAVIGARQEMQPLRAILIALGVGHVHVHAELSTIVELLRAGQIDTVFIDVDRPEVDGIATARAIRADASLAGRGVPVICVAREGSVDRVRRAIGAGADEFLSLPVRPIDVFRCLVAATGDQWPRIASSDYLGPDRRRAPSEGYRGRERCGR